MNRLPFLPLAAAGLLVFPVVGCASSLRAQRSVAGARGTLEAYIAAVIAGNGRAACSLLAPAARIQLAEAANQSSCAEVVEIGALFLRSRPAEAAQLRSYASKVKVTLRGNTATVPNMGGGGRTTLTYTHGLWYVVTS